MIWAPLYQISKTNLKQLADSQDTVEMCSGKKCPYHTCSSSSFCQLIYCKGSIHIVFPVVFFFFPLSCFSLISKSLLVS